MIRTISLLILLSSLLSQDLIDKSQYNIQGGAILLNDSNEDWRNVKVEIIAYRIVPSSNPVYGCWSELDVMWPEYINEDIRERLTITIVNQELYNDIPDYVDIEGKSYYMLKLPSDRWMDRSSTIW